MTVRATPISKVRLFCGRSKNSCTLGMINTVITPMMKNTADPNPARPGKEGEAIMTKLLTTAKAISAMTCQPAGECLQNAAKNRAFLAG